MGAKPTGPMRSFYQRRSTPGGWVFEGSLSQKAGFVPTEQVNDRLKFLRSEAGVDVYLNLETGEEVFQGRTR